MDTKRNLRYFTAPLISPYTVIGLVVAIAGFVVCRLFMSEIQWVAFIGLVIPELNGKLIGSAQRVPVPTGSTTILTAVVKGKDVTKEGINAAMKAAASESFGYNDEPIVSSDVIGMRYGSLFDATQTMVAKIDDDTYQVQVVSWYDNENSYTSQMVRTIKYFAELA